MDLNKWLVQYNGMKGVYRPEDNIYNNTNIDLHNYDYYYTNNNGDIDLKYNGASKGLNTVFFDNKRDVCHNIPFDSNHRHVSFLFNELVNKSIENDIAVTVPVLDNNKIEYMDVPVFWKSMKVPFYKFIMENS
jgi:hypothetical protein